MADVVLSAEDLERMSKLPGKAELIATLIARIQGPAWRFGQCTQSWTTRFGWRLARDRSERINTVVVNTLVVVKETVWQKKQKKQSSLPKLQKTRWCRQGIVLGWSVRFGQSFRRRIQAYPPLHRMMMGAMPAGAGADAAPSRRIFSNHQELDLTSFSQDGGSNKLAPLKLWEPSSKNLVWVTRKPSLNPSPKTVLGRCC